MALQVLVLEPDGQVAAEIVSALNEAVPGTRQAVAGSLAEAQELVLDQKPILFVLDVDATHDLAQEFIYDLRTSHPGARAIILTGSHFNAQREQVASLGAIHFLEKPFPKADFMTLVEALLAPEEKGEGERFQGTLSDLHIADIIQLKCISGATSMLEFTGPKGEKARVYFQNGQVRHATAPGKEGLAAFNEIVDWKGGLISEVPVPAGVPHTIDLDWQVLLMEAVRNIDETKGAAAAAPVGKPASSQAKKILVIDDSVMLLSFVKEILEDENYQVATAATAADGLSATRSGAPDLILLDFILPDMKGDQVCRELMLDPATAQVPVIYVSGFGSDLQPDSAEIPNVIGSLNKPFTSEALIAAVAKYLGGQKKAPNENKTLPPVSAPPVVPAPEPAVASAVRPPAGPIKAAPPAPVAPAEPSPPPPSRPITAAAPVVAASAADAPSPAVPASSNAYFCGDSSFFSLHWALQTIANEKLTGALRAFWSKDPVELIARAGEIVLVTTRNPSLYCEESPVTLLNVEREEVEQARARQTRDGSPLFLTLADAGLILREPGLQLVEHYGQKLFSQLWTERVRFTFEQQSLPDYVRGLPPADDSVDQWALSTLRFVQYQELDAQALADTASVPAYTRDGFDRVQELRLTVAEAQFASQFNGTRSIAQISKNLKLDIKFARLTLFRFLALEIVECWPGQVSAKPESRGGLRGMFNR